MNKGDFMKIYSYKNDCLQIYENLIEGLNLDLKKDKIITVVGAGGKTSTIFKLAKELSSLNKKVIITTTTHMDFNSDFILINDEKDIIKIQDTLKNKNTIKIARQESDVKVKSLDLDILKRIIYLSEFVLIEGDGSKNLPLKGTKKNEPVIINETNLVIGIIGFDSINKKIKDICHRPEIVSKLLKKNLDDYVDYKDLVKVASAKDGLKKNINCKYKVIINKVDKNEDLKTCKKIADLSKKKNIEVIFTSHK